MMWWIKSFEEADAFDYLYFTISTGMILYTWVLHTGTMYGRLLFVECKGTVLERHKVRKELHKSLSEAQGFRRK